MKKKTSDYDEYIETQNQLELGLVYYSMARNSLHELITAWKEGKDVDEEKYKTDMKTLLMLSGQFLSKTKIPEINAIHARLASLIEDVTNDKI